MQKRAHSSNYERCNAEQPYRQTTNRQLTKSKTKRINRQAATPKIDGRVNDT